MSYVLPFKKGQKLIELGGGDSPFLRPNADFRKLPTVDIVCDFEKRFPIENESYDGVFAKFVIEHISWRHVPHFVSEIYRILKPGGLAVLIGPNTLEQCREIIRRNKIGIEENALLFGGQEGSWEETGNYHKSAFSFQYVQKLFKDAGFSEVVTKPLPTCHTDMIIEARKGVQQDPLTRIKQSEWYKELKDDLERASGRPIIKGNLVVAGKYTSRDLERIKESLILDYEAKHGHGYRKNDDASNIIILCPNCHALEHLKMLEKQGLDDTNRISLPVYTGGKKRWGVH